MTKSTDYRSLSRCSLKLSVSPRLMIFRFPKFKRLLVTKNSKDVVEKFVHDGHKSYLFILVDAFRSVEISQNWVDRLTISRSSNGGHGDCKENSSTNPCTSFRDLVSVSIEFPRLIDRRIKSKECREGFRRVEKTEVPNLSNKCSGREKTNAWYFVKKLNISLCISGEFLRFNHRFNLSLNAMVNPAAKDLL